jgi:DNA polymerase III subunit beta
VHYEDVLLWRITTDCDVAISSDSLEIAFNVKYLIDVLSVIGSNQVSLEMTDAASPGVLRIVGDETFTHVIMPMHVG